MEKRIFGLIDEGGFVYHDDERFRRNYCEIVLSDWLMRAIESAEVVTISNDYFRLRRPLERRLYEIGRKHCGDQPKWHIGLEKLQTKTGSNAPLKRFRLNLRQIIKEDHTPFYRMELTDNDLVIFRPREAKREVLPSITVTRKAEDQCRKIAIEKGWDFYALKENWLDFVRRKIKDGDAPKSADASMIAYFKKAEKQR
jgi:plasmid replication initiation protein